MKYLYLYIYETCKELCVCVCVHVQESMYIFGCIYVLIVWSYVYIHLWRMNQEKFISILANVVSQFCVLQYTFVCRRSHLTQWFCILYFPIVCNLVGITYKYLSMQLIYNSFLMYSNLIEVFSIKMNWCSTFMSSPTLLQNLFPDSRERNDISNKLKHKLVRKTSKQVNGSSSRSCLEEPPLSGLFTKKVINPSTKFSALLILCFVEEKFLMLLSSW